MNILNRTLFAVTLAFIIPLSIQAHLLDGVAAQAQQYKNVAHGALNNQKSISSNAYKIFKLLDYITLITPPLAEGANKQYTTSAISNAFKKIYQNFKNFTSKQTDI